MPIISSSITHFCFLQRVDVDLVMSRTQCSPEEAARALRDCDGDVSAAIRSFRNAPKVLNLFLENGSFVFSFEMGKFIVVWLFFRMSDTRSCKVVVPQ